MVFEAFHASSAGRAHLGRIRDGMVGNCEEMALGFLSIGARMGGQRIWADWRDGKWVHRRQGCRAEGEWQTESRHDPRAGSVATDWTCHLRELSRVPFLYYTNM